MLQWKAAWVEYEHKITEIMFSGKEEKPESKDWKK